MSKFQQIESIPQAQQVTPQLYSDRQFMHTLLAGVVLPLAQAAVTAGMVMLGAVALLYQFNAIDLFKPALIVGVITLVATWLYLQRRWLKITALEQILRIDINGDGQIGKAEQQEQKPETVIRLEEIKDNSHFESHTYRLPITDDELIKLADGLINRNRPFSRREWTPAARGFSDDKYRELQSALIKFGLIEARGAGFEMTRPGRALMKHYASLSPTPVIEPAEK